MLRNLWQSFLLLAPFIVGAVVAFAVVWLAARYPAVPEGIEAAYWRKYSRRFWRRVRGMRP